MFSPHITPHHHPFPCFLQKQSLNRAAPPLPPHSAAAMSSQRPGRHQRRASQSVFVLPDNFADLDDVPASGGGEDGRKASAPDAAGGGQQGRPAAAAARHRRAMSVAVASRELEMIKEDMGSYKIGA